MPCAGADGDRGAGAAATPGRRPAHGRSGGLRRRAGAAGALPAPALVLGSVISVQTGQALGKRLFDATGSPAGAVSVRLGLAALFLLVLWRPRPPRQRRDVLLVLGYGTAIAGMNLVYPAMARMPLGVAVTLQLTGPLAVSLLASRRWSDAGWGALALAGVVLFLAPGRVGRPPSASGLAFAAGSALAMGSYLLVSRRAGARTSGGGPLALAVSWAALITLPYGLVESGGRLAQGDVLRDGAVVALLSAAVPYSLELTALRRLPVRVVGVLQSLEPVAAGVAGLALLGELLTPVQWLATGCITVASVGAVTRRDRPPVRAGSSPRTRRPPAVRRPSSRPPGRS